jgi:tryptophanyl-tRNA synthetase
LRYKLIEGSANDINDIVGMYKDSSYKEFKEYLAEEVCKFIGDVQDKYYKIREDEEYLKKVLNIGALKARSYADKKLVEVRKKVGIYI